MAITDPDTYQRVPLDPDLAERYAKEVGALKAIECQHEQTQFRRGFNKGGGPIVKKQCLSCGLLVGNPVSRTPETDLLDEIDEAHNPAYEAKRKCEWDELRRRYVALQESRWRGSAQGKSYFQRSHANYLNSPEWAERRLQVMDRANSLCEGCRKTRASEVHHLSYRNWGNEFLFELVALCGDCHDRIHRLDEGREAGCIDCVHGGDHGEWCYQFEMPTAAALIPGGACGPERQRFVDADEYG
ncbi:MAG: HNH endonuclease [Sagittula sp.]|uniref:HNH endonuclease n=1 Tax=Rhodobacterales TaxID=204455 RepID=UPI00405A0CF8